MVSLAEARDKARDARKLVEAGENPIDAKRKAMAGATFGEIADELIAAKESEWRNKKHREQWRYTLATYAAQLRPLHVEKIDTAAVLAVLTPIWQTRPATASRVRGRIEAVLDAARARGLIGHNEANPARWRGHLDKLLPKRGKLTLGHHAAMAYRDVPAFIERLRKRKAIAALALEFCILTAARSGEVLGARWSEIDLAAKVWTVPAGRMKAAREHRIPLSDRVLAILEMILEARTSEFVFPGVRPGAPLMGTALRDLLERMKLDSVTVHGFRSTFRDWCGNETHFPREVAEVALAHVVGSAVEQAYRRSDALEKRRALMNAWAQYIEPRNGSNVVALARRKKSGAKSA